MNDYIVTLDALHEASTAVPGHRCTPFKTMGTAYRSAYRPIDLAVQK
jgi:hypothetical protein